MASDNDHAGGIARAHFNFFEELISWTVEVDRCEACFWLQSRREI